MTFTLSEAARSVLACADARGKSALTGRFASSWRAGEIGGVGKIALPVRPGRPAQPELRPPREMPRRRAGGLAGRTALLHSLAHIELNAVDLAWDLIGRFVDEDLPRDFYDDWVTVADDEARHFTLLADRLEALGSHYGALPAHDGLWLAAQRTAHDLLARLAIVPLVLEARGLDVTPGIATRLREAGDPESAAIVDLIAAEEVSHVGAGWRWFSHVASARGLEPEATHRELVQTHYGARPKPPFNTAARRKAGLPPTLCDLLT